MIPVRRTGPVLESRQGHGIRQTPTSQSENTRGICEPRNGVDLNAAQGRCGKPSSARAALMTIHKLVLDACLAFRFSEGHWGDEGRGSPVLNDLEEKERGKAESGRQNINGEDESPACL